jgi:hypothetical protein
LFYPGDCEGDVDAEQRASLQESEAILIMEEFLVMERWRR